VYSANFLSMYNEKCTKIDKTVPNFRAHVKAIQNASDAQIHNSLIRPDLSPPACIQATILLSSTSKKIAMVGSYNL
jgi:hypothetical protein